MEPFVVLLGIAGLWFLVRNRNSQRSDSRWTTTQADGNQTAWLAAGSDAAATVKRSSSTTRLAVALWPGEARRWCGTLSFALAMALVILEFATLGPIWGDDGDVAAIPWLAGWMPIIAWPTAGMVLVGVHFAATRVRRHGAQELFDSLPTAREVRTFGTFSIAFVGVAALVVLNTGLLVTAKLQGFVGGIDLRSITEIATGLVVVLGAASFGMLLSRGLPWPLVPIAALVAIAMVNGRLIDDTTLWDRRRWVAIWPGFPELIPRIDSRPFAAHLAYLAMLSIACAAIAIVVHRVTPLRVVAVASSVALAMALGFLQNPRVSAGGADAVARLVFAPKSAQVCRADSLIEACAYEPFDQALGRWLSVATRVRAQAPDSRLGRLAMMQQLSEPFIKRIDVRVRSTATAQAARQQQNGALLLGFRNLAVPANEFAFAASVAQQVVGLPYPTATARDTCSVAGQARGVVALWMAATALNDGVKQLAKTPESPWMPTGYFIGDQQSTFVVPWGFDSMPTSNVVVFEAADITAAHALAQRPVGDTRNLIAQYWDDLMDPVRGRATMSDVFGIQLQPASPGLRQC